ncbi:delta-like protein [Plakobranchus ocellatus]|uniref:Delta-like protein n=1 Tax=Plakobranchus ocellatus TaxID=259542 RepID=A0AAV3ZI07_9GAST|nr:delta-like protein [Plakobranchus ocellatus]
MLGASTVTHMTKAFAATIFITSILVLQPSNGSGRISLRLVNYTNPTGHIKQLGGGVACCDQPSGDVTSCLAGLCDPVFVLCITPTTRRRFCDYLNVTSKVYRNTNLIIFNGRPFDSDALGSGPVEPNVYLPSTPAVSSRFKIWDGSIFIKIQVLESDQWKPATMTEMSLPYAVSTPSQSGSLEWTTLVLKEDGITLTLDISVQCDEGFRDMFCSCQDRNTTQEHTMCTRETERVCLPGWAEPPGLKGPIKCLQSTLPCHPDNDPCKNNATCGTYFNGTDNVIVCSCLQDFTGEKCETPITTTTTSTTTTTTAQTTFTTTASSIRLVSATSFPKQVPTASVATSVPKLLSPTTSLPWTQVPANATTADAFNTTTEQSSLSMQTSGTTTVMVVTKGRTTTATTGTKVTQSQTQSTASPYTKPGNPSRPGMSNITSAPAGTHASQASSIGGGGGDNTAAVAGGVAGTLASLLLAALLILFRKKLFKKKQPTVSDVERESVENLQKAGQDTESVNKPEELICEDPEVPENNTVEENGQDTETTENVN